MPEKEAFEPTFRDAAVLPVILQGLLWVFGGLVLDGGVLSRTVVYSALFFWAAVFATAAVRRIAIRPGLSMTDYLLVKYGYVIVAIVVGPLALLVDALRS